MSAIRKIMAKRFQFSVAQIVFSVYILIAVSAGIVAIAQWRFNLLDRAQTKFERFLSYSAPSHQSTKTKSIPETPPAVPYIQNTVLNPLAVRSRPATEGDLLIAENEDRDYLQSILNTIFPDGMARLSKEEISITILRYVTSRLEPKPNSGSATKILHEGYALCGGTSDSLRVLVRLAGIPARNVNIYGLPSLGGHTLVEIYYEDQWHLYDPTFGLVLYSEPEYNGAGRIPSLDELITSSAKGWYIFKIVNHPWRGYDESTRSFGVVRAEEDYLSDFHDFPFLTQYRQMFATTFSVAYDENQIISFPVVADLTHDGKYSVGRADHDNSDIIAATSSMETAGKAGMYYLVGGTGYQYVHTWFIKSPSPGFVRITYYSTESQPAALMLFPLKGVYVVSASQDDQRAEFLLRVSDPDASVQFWA